MNKLSFLYTCDNAFIPLASISIASIIKHNSDSKMIFYIATESDNNENFIKLKKFYKDNRNVNFKYLNCQKYDYLLKEKDFDRWGSNSYYVYWRLFAYDLIKEDYVWYVDTDVICTNKIINPELNDKTLGIVIDSIHACYNKIAGIDVNKYFYNTGTILVDTKKWKDNKCTNKIVDYIKEMKHKPIMCDQDIITNALYNDIIQIDSKYNYFAGYDYYGIHNSFEMYSLDKKPFYTEKEIINSSKNVIFYHCLEGVFGRPWQKGNNCPRKEEYSEYRKISAWPDYEKELNISILFKIEKALEVLPKPIYNKIHNLAMKIYYNKQGNKK